MMSEETNDFKPLADADDATSQQPVTAEMLGITPKDTGLPLVVVSAGHGGGRLSGHRRCCRYRSDQQFRNRQCRRPCYG